MVVDAVESLDTRMTDIRMVGSKDHWRQCDGLSPGAGRAFKKTFSYAGFEQQPKHHQPEDPVLERGAGAQVGKVQVRIGPTRPVDC